MILGGLQKLTLIDYPGQIAATVFTVGCNFRCPFCHNPELVLLSEEFERGSISEVEFFEFLKSRKGKLDGVCVTGGEPTIQPDILDFLRKIKKLGFLVKLDSNGTRPDVLEKAFSEKLIDYVAMDIKNCLESYNKTCGAVVDLEKIKLSIDLIRNSKIPYEFRTTVVPGIHTMKDFDLMGKWLDGIKNFALQEYRDEGKILDPTLKEKTKGKKMDLEKIKNKLQKHFEKVALR